MLKGSIFPHITLWPLYCLPIRQISRLNGESTIVTAECNEPNNSIEINIKKKKY